MRVLSPQTYNLSPCHRGQATLSLALVIGGTAILIALTLAFLTISFINSASAYQSATRALAAASAGASDAILQLARSKGFASSYTLDVDGVSVQISVTNPGVVANTVDIASEASVRGARRRLEVVLSSDSATGAMSIISWEQAAIP